MKGTYFEKRNNFSELHYELPANYGMFDVDLFQGQWLNIEIESTKKEATYIEYRCLRYDANGNKFNLDRFKPVAMFEFKHNGSESVKKSIRELKEGSALWAEFMFCKIVGMRFFVVVATQGKVPFHFIEFNISTGNFTIAGTLTQYSKEAIIDFWKNTLHLSNG